MQKSQRNALIGVGAIALWAGLSWFAGLRNEARVHHYIDLINTQLQAHPLGRLFRVEVDSLERRTFSSDIQYRATLFYPGLGEEGEAVFLLHEHLSHGPFPLPRLKRAQLWPVRGDATFELVQNDSTEAWFALLGEGQAPLSGHATIDLGRNVDAELSFPPLTFENDEADLNFSGLNLQLGVQRRGLALTLSGNMDELTLKVKDDYDPGQLELKGLTLGGQSHQGASGLQIGASELAVDEINLMIENIMSLRLRDYQQRYDLSESRDGSLLAANVLYELGLGMTPSGGQEINLTLNGGFGARDLATAPTLTLLEIYDRMMARSLQFETDEALEQQDLKLATKTFRTWLAANPTLYIDPLRLSNEGGETRFDLRLELADPGAGAFNQTPEEIIPNLLRELRANLSLSKPMIRSLLIPLIQASGSDEAAAAQEADATIAQLTAWAQSYSYLQNTGDELVSALSYRDGELTINGNAVPADDVNSLVALWYLFGFGIMGDVYNDDYYDYGYDDYYYDDKSSKQK
ncbi:MAG: YdgA family protein [Pseudomonadales bacterium]|jgi:uncharacterized protein YdgA (DUF945 family)|nr:YdgA family protein [Pseudomonadales bacterium]